MRQTTKRFQGERTCSMSSITMPSLVGIGFHPPPGWPKTLSFFVCLSVCLCLFVRHAFERQRLYARFRHEGVGVQKRFYAVVKGRFVVVHQCSTLSDCCQLATTLNAKIQKSSKNWSFSPTEGERINRSRRNLAHTVGLL